MSKAHRGKGIRTLPNHGRGTCPICKRDEVKILYEMEIEGSKRKICKNCKATLANKKAADEKKVKVAAKAAPSAPLVSQPEPATAEKVNSEN